MIDFTKYSVKELRELQNSIGTYLTNINDGFIYICEVRSYGSSWTLNFTNELPVNDLCVTYDGQDGIVDVYTTNPNAKISNYGGEVNYIESQMNYDRWKKANDLVHTIRKAEDDIKRWKDRDNIPFHSRPSFEPVWSEEDVVGMKKVLEEIGEYENPTPINVNSYDEEY